MHGAPIQDRPFEELTTRQFHDLLRLRVDVFVVEQECRYGELDGRDTDPTTRHIWIDDADATPLAYLRLLTEPDAVRIGRVATRAEARSRGLAGRLVEYVTSSHAGPWILDAQTYLRDWYREHGFEPTGPEYLEDGIPHIPMRREPDS